MNEEKRVSKMIDRKVSVWMSIYESLSQEPMEEEEMKPSRKPLAA